MTTIAPRAYARTYTKTIKANSLGTWVDMGIVLEDGDGLDVISVNGNIHYVDDTNTPFDVESDGGGVIFRPGLTSGTAWWGYPEGAYYREPGNYFPPHPDFTPNLVNQDDYEATPRMVSNLPPYCLALAVVPDGDPAPAVDGSFDQGLYPMRGRVFAASDLPSGGGRLWAIFNDNYSHSADNQGFFKIVFRRLPRTGDPFNTHAYISVRVWNADNTSWQEAPLASEGLPGVANGIDARVTAKEGYSDATIPFYGTLADFSYLVRRRRIELFAIYSDRITGQRKEARLWRGLIKRLKESKSSTGLKSVLVNAYGIWSDVSKVKTWKRYANAKQQDRGAIFRDLVNNYVTQYFPNIEIEAGVTGSIPQYFDAYGKRFGNAIEDLTQNLGQIATGSDVGSDETKDRIFIRPFDNDETGTARHVLMMPDNQTGVRNREIDDSNQSTVVDIAGGAARFGNILADAVDGNTSFEDPQLPGADLTGNYLANGSFEDGTTLWGFHSGASRKTQEDEGVQPYTGTAYAELDAVGENVEQTRNPPSTAIIVGKQYSIDVRARIANEGKLAEGEIILKWLDSGGGTLSTETFAVAPTSTIWDLFPFSSVAPSSATGISIEVNCTVSPDVTYALLIDEVRFYDPVGATQKGWWARTYGSAIFNLIIWDDDSHPWHHAYAPFFDVSASDADGEDAHIEPFGEARFSVTGGQTLHCGFAVALHPDTASLDFIVEARGWGQDGRYHGKTQNPVTVLYSPNYVIIYVNRAFGEDDAQGTVSLIVRGSGKFWVDGAFAFDINAPTVDVTKPDEFIEQNQFRAVRRVSDFYPTGDIADEAAAVGDIPTDEDISDIVSDADADSYAAAYFKARTLPIDRPDIETFGIISTGNGNTNASMMPGELMRAVGSDASIILPHARCLNEKQIRWESNRLTITLYPMKEPRNPARAIEEMIRRNYLAGKVAGGSSGSSSTAGGGLSGSAGGGTTVTEEERTLWDNIAAEVIAARDSDALGSFASLDERLEAMETGGAGQYMLLTNSDPDDTQLVADGAGDFVYVWVPY